MARIHTHYDNLKVARNAPPEVIRAAYKTLSQKYHPDRNQDNPEAIRIIQIINTAYEVLSDPERRAAHDRWIAKAEAAQDTKKTVEPPPRSPGAPHRRPASSTPSRHRRPSSKLSPLQRFESMMDSFFKNLLRKLRHAPQAQNGRHR